MFRVKCRELSSISGASSYSHVCIYVCGFFEALGSYRTPHLGGKPSHQRMPIIGARRVHVHE